MMAVIIVDDEVSARRTLRELCAEEADLAVVGEFGDGETAHEAICRLKPQVLFLDIQMSPITGIELARSLPSESLPSLVFVTAYDTYALQAFEVCAVDYLLKPFDQARFRNTLNRVRPRHATGAAAEGQAALEALLTQWEFKSRAHPAERPRLLAELNGRLHLLDATRIEAIESDRNYITIRVGQTTYHARSTLSHAEQTMRTEPMLRISRSCLVNINHVTEINRTLRGDFILVLAGGATLTSSEGFRTKVKEYLASLRLTP